VGRDCYLKGPWDPRTFQTALKGPWEALESVRFWQNQTKLLQYHKFAARVRGVPRTFQQQNHVERSVGLKGPWENISSHFHDSDFRFSLFGLLALAKRVCWWTRACPPTGGKPASTSTPASPGLAARRRAAGGDLSASRATAPCRGCRAAADKSPSAKRRVALAHSLRHDQQPMDAPANKPVSPGQALCQCAAPEQVCQRPRASPLSGGSPRPLANLFSRCAQYVSVSSIGK